ncbi:MAG TPA: cellulose biosynthesis protein BcsQ [Pseudomonas sp.]
MTLHEVDLPVFEPRTALSDQVDVRPAGKEAEDEDVWSSAGLQGLLAKLAREGSAPALCDDVRPPAAPSLEHVRVVAVISAKGGVGKTTLSANLAVALHQAGKPVVALDLDPQNALRQHFKAVAGTEENLSATGVAQGEQDWFACGMPSDGGVFVLPYGDVDEERRQAFESQLNASPDWLKRHLTAMGLAEGTVILIDTPPGPSIYLRQALSIANEVIVVTLADAASYTALPQADKLIRTYTAGRDDFSGTSYLINQVDGARRLNRDITQILQELLGQQVLGVVHHDPSIGDALAYNRNVLDYDPRGRGCSDILDCCNALGARLAVTPTACAQ